MKKFLFIFPPKHLSGKEYYFRVQQEIEILKVDSQLKFIEIRNTNKKSAFLKWLLFLRQIPSNFKKIKSSNTIILYPSPANYLFIPLCRLLNKRIIIDHFTTSVFNFEIVKNRWYKYVFMIMDKYLYKHVHQIITHTHSMKIKLRDFYKLKPSQIGVVYSSVDTRLFRPERKLNSLRKKLGINHNENVVIYSGLFHPFHGVDIILKAADILKGEKIKFLIIGRKLQIISNVISIGPVLYKELPEYLIIGDIWVGGVGKGIQAERALSSNMLAAMSCGLPIITSTSEENLRVIKNNYNGIYVERENINELSSTIRKTLMDPKKLKTLGTNARLTIRKNYSLASMKKSLNKII